MEDGERSLRRTTSGGAPGGADMQTVQKNFDNGAKDTSNHLKSLLVPSRVSFGIAGAEQLYQVARMIKGNPERVVRGQHPVVIFGGPLVQVLTRFLLNFCFSNVFFASVLAPHFFPSPPPSRSHAPLV